MLDESWLSEQVFNPDVPILVRQVIMKVNHSLHLTSTYEILEQKLEELPLPLLVLPPHFLLPELQFVLLLPPLAFPNTLAHEE